MIEAQAHCQLLAFLRAKSIEDWPHYLTMARLVARTLRLGRSALIQTGGVAVDYQLSYLTPALLSHRSVILVAPETTQRQVLQKYLPQLQQHLNTNKRIIMGDRLSTDDFPAITITSFESWLEDRLQNQGRFPANIPTVIDRADYLEEWTFAHLTLDLTAQDWNDLMLICSQHQDLIRDLRAQLTRAIFSHPTNPYECFLLNPSEEESLASLLTTLAETAALPPKIAKFWHYWQKYRPNNSLLWTTIKRTLGQFTLHLTPKEIASSLARIWQQQPLVLIGGFLDWEKEAPIYRAALGLPDSLCLKFAHNQDQQQIQLYLPERLPFPNTPEFRTVFSQETWKLLSLTRDLSQFTVVIIGDVPLKAQIAVTMASEFGSRVQVEKTNLAENATLICGWEFWHQHHHNFPTPQLLIIATLPIPSPENPLVAGRVAYHKRLRQDWFRCYLLPTALRKIQRAVIPIRKSQGTLALLDNRVNHRSYGTKILHVLEPYARINYIDSSCFN